MWSRVKRIHIKIFAGAPKGDCISSLFKELLVIKAGMLLRWYSCHYIHFLYSIMNMNFSADVRFKPSIVNQWRGNSTNRNCLESVLHVQLSWCDMVTKLTSYKHCCGYQIKIGKVKKNLSLNFLRFVGMTLINSHGVRTSHSHRAVRNPVVGVYVSNGLCEHLWTCERCVYFCEPEQWSNLSCEQASTLEKYGWRAAGTS